MSGGRRVCVFCGGRANSAEHIFKRDFKRTLGIGAPVDRAFAKTDIDGNVTLRPDPPFDLKVRRVCRDCNSGWMNRLDLAVEPWIVNPDDQTAYQRCDPTGFRRWAIKLALMRSLIDHAMIVPRDYFERLFRGEDLEEWHVFVGRSFFKEFRHAFAGVRVGRNDPAREVGYGILHASWALGNAVVSAVCIPGGDPERHFFPSFRIYNVNQGKPLVEIPFGASALPDVFAHRKLGAFQTEPFFMFFTPTPVSPIEDDMRAVYQVVRDAPGRRRSAAAP